MLHVQSAREKLSIIRQGALGRAEQGRLIREVRALVAELENLVGSDLLQPKGGLNAEAEIQNLKREVTKTADCQNSNAALSRLPKGSRQAYEKVFSLIYECAPSRTVAKALVDRILVRLG